MKIFRFAMILLSQFALVASCYANNVEKVVIIGAGAAGATAAIFTAQANLHPLVIHDTDCNAQMSLIHKIDNYPGTLEEIEGVDLLHKFRSQAEQFGARFTEEKVVAVDLLDKPFKIYFDSGNIVYSDSVIITSGTKKRWLSLENEQNLRGHGVISATFCTSLDYSGKHIIVVGGGHAALQEAFYVSDKAEHVTIVNRGNSFNASKFHQNAVFETENIDIKYNTEVEEIVSNAEGRLSFLRLKDKASGRIEAHPADYLVIAIGNTPNTQLFQDQLEITENGNIVINGKTTATEIPGVFAAGDITDVAYGRVVIAAGAGAMAALDATRYLDTLNKRPNETQ